MNALQPTLLIDASLHTSMRGSVTHLPAVTMTEHGLELTLPDGWMLRDGTHSQLSVVRGCLWLTDTHGIDLWLKDGNRQILNADTLVTAEQDTVVQLMTPHALTNAWQPRLQMHVRKQLMTLQPQPLSLWQKFLHTVRAS